MSELQRQILNLLDTYQRPLSVRKVLSLLQDKDLGLTLTLSDVAIALKKLRGKKQVHECRRAVYQIHRPKLPIASPPTKTVPEKVIQDTLDYQEIRQATRIAQYLKPYPSTSIHIPEIITRQKKLTSQYFTQLWIDLETEVETTAQLCRIKKKDHTLVDDSIIQEPPTNDTTLTTDLIPNFVDQFTHIESSIQAQLELLETLQEQHYALARDLLERLTPAQLAILVKQVLTHIGYQDIKDFDQGFKKYSQCLQYKAQNTRQQNVFILVNMSHDSMKEQEVEEVIAEGLVADIDVVVILHTAEFEKKFTTKNIQLIDLHDFCYLLCQYQNNL